VIKVENPRGGDACRVCGRPSAKLAPRLGEDNPEIVDPAL